MTLKEQITRLRDETPEDWYTAREAYDKLVSTVCPGEDMRECGPQPSSSAIPVIPDAVREALTAYLGEIHTPECICWKCDLKPEIRAFLASSPTVTRDELREKLEPVVRDAMQGAHDSRDPIAEIASTVADAVLALLRGGAQ